MIPQINPSILAQGFVRIHRAITRGLSVSIEKGTEFIQTNFQSPEIKKGYTDYVLSLAIVLSAHHLSEDEVAFPMLKEMIPNAPYDRLTADHHAIESLLHSIRASVVNVAVAGPGESLLTLVDDLHKVADVWTPHIQVEEMNFSEKAIAFAMDPEAELQINAALSKHGQEHATPGYLALPFMLYNLNPTDRAEFEASMPDVVKNELIPIVWKDQWAAMKPFFMD